MLGVTLEIEHIVFDNQAIRWHLAEIAVVHLGTESGFIAGNYERPLGNNLLFGVTANVQYRSKTVLSATRPNATYQSYATVDANVRVGTQDGRWQLAVIGKNLTDKLAIRTAANVPGTGGNTGTNEGFVGDLQGNAIRPLQIELELLYRFAQ